MIPIEELKTIVVEVLQLGCRGDGLDSDSGLLGCIPEFDSMAVVSLITAMEDNFGIVVDDDEISAETFATLGSVHQYLCSNVAA